MLERDESLHHKDDLTEVITKCRANSSLVSFLHKGAVYVWLNPTTLRSTPAKHVKFIPFGSSIGQPLASLLPSQHEGVLIGHENGLHRWYGKGRGPPLMATVYLGVFHFKYTKSSNKNMSNMSLWTIVSQCRRRRIHFSLISSISSSKGKSQW